MSRTTLLAAAIVVTSALTAQNIVIFPSDHTGPNVNQAGMRTLPGATYVGNVPFSNGISRNMIIYDPWDLGVPNGRNITKIGFPKDNATSSTSVGYAVQMEIRMGYSRLSQPNVSRTFDQNYDGSPVVVFARQILTLPDLGIATSGNRQEMWVTLDTPFPVDTARALVVDYKIFANSNSNSRFNYWLDGAQFVSPVQSFGQACQTSGGRLPALASRPTYVGGNWSMTLSNGPANSNISLLVGLQKLIPPIDLGPFGAPNCQVFVSPLFVGLDTSNSSGWKSWSFPVPFNVALHQGHLFSQVAMEDLFANNLGVIMSNGDDLQLGVKPQGALVYATNDANAQNGSLAANYGLITMFDHD